MALKHFKSFFYERDIFIAREMTKIFEEDIRDKLKNIKFFEKEPKGELTVVISNVFQSEKKINFLNQSVKNEIKTMLKKYSSKDVVSFISKKEDISKKIVYEYCLKQTK